MRIPFLLILCGPLCLAHEDDSELVFDRFFGGDDGWSFQLQSEMESRYASEGRDMLDGDSLATATFEAAWNAASLGIWYGKSPDQSYDELHLSGALGWEWEDLKWYVSYTHLRFPDDGAHDHEVGAGISWVGLPLEMHLSADAYFSLEAEGTFIETSLHRDFPVSECLTIHPSLVFGINQGYVSDGHDGANHISLRLGGEYQFAPSLTLSPM